MKCFKDLKRECNPRKCNQVCYIKDKNNDLLHFFNSNKIGERQKQVNNLALDIYQELSHEILDNVVEMVYKKTKMYPNVEVINIIRERIKGINSI